ncbi:MAG: hypothetical protein WA672_17240, partial [Candidatus Angelobacter sp.]
MTGTDYLAARARLAVVRFAVLDLAAVLLFTALLFTVLLLPALFFSAPPRLCGEDVPSSPTPAAFTQTTAGR